MTCLHISYREVAHTVCASEPLKWIPRMMEEDRMRRGTVIDSEALRARYEQERARRVRADGATQYVDINAHSDDYIFDPYEPRVERPPLTDRTEVIVLGGGLGGMLAAIQLKQRGIEDIRIVEKASDFGGTWYWNCYPGAQCDVESYMYLPLLEETSYI